MSRNLFRSGLIIAALAAAPSLLVAPTVFAQSAGLVATVNNYPITRLDIDRRLRMLQIMGRKFETTQQTRREVLRIMIDEVIQIAEAKRFKMNPSERDISQRIQEIAKNMKTDLPGLEAKLAAQGLTMEALRHYIEAQISMNRILVGKYKVKFSLDEADIDAKYAEIKGKYNAQMNKILNDPRMKPVQVYQLMQIELPIENADDPMLAQARAIEANQLMRRFKGCNSARSAASGIFNVKVGKRIDAVASKLPPELRKALEAAGVGRAVGPARGPKGVQVIAFCGKRTVTPPKPKFEMPTREQIANAARSEKFGSIEEKYMKEMRKRAFVDYKDSAYVLSD